MNCKTDCQLGLARSTYTQKTRGNARTYDSLAQQRAHASQSLTTNGKVLELLGQHGLEVLGVKGEQVLAQTSLETEGRNVASGIVVAHDVSAALEQLWHHLVLVRLDDLQDIPDSEGVLGRGHGRWLAAQAFGILTVPPFLAHDAQDESKADEDQEEACKSHDGQSST